MSEPSDSGTPSAYNDGWTKTTCTIPDLPYSGEMDIAVHTAIAASSWLTPCPGTAIYNGYRVWTGFTITSQSNQHYQGQINNSYNQSTGYTQQMYGQSTGYTENYAYSKNQVNLLTGDTLNQSMSYTDNKVSGITSGVTLDYLQSNYFDNTQTFSNKSDLQLATSRSVILPSDGHLYFGDPTTAGTMYLKITSGIGKGTMAFGIIKTGGVPFEITSLSGSTS